MDYLDAAKRNNQCNFKIHKIHKCTVISKKKKYSEMERQWVTSCLQKK